LEQKIQIKQYGGHYKRRHTYNQHEEFESRQKPEVYVEEISHFVADTGVFKNKVRTTDKLQTVSTHNRFRVVFHARDKTDSRLIVAKHE
jgi:hypothetical protein